MRATLIAGFFLLCACPVQAQELGAFDGQFDVGMVTPPGAAVHDAASGDYVITSAGANIWARVDGFHYLWKKMSGDAVLTADITFPPIAYNHPPVPHRKAVLMFRQSLDPGAAQVSVHLHGVGMTALQYRRERGANTESTELNIDAPRTLRLESAATSTPCSCP